MPAFYNRERARLGALSGTIISFPKQLTSTDPTASSNRELLPAGYLRCDGSVLFATEYPILAGVLGTGGECRFKKPDQNLDDNQFQLPDLRNKHIRATTSANIGLYNDLFVVNDAGDTIPKAGVGLAVIQNIDSPYELTYTGDFYIPPQTVTLRGEPSFTVDSGSYTFSSEVPQNAFQPHLHRTTTTRVRQFDRNSNHFSSRQRNYVRTKSSLEVCNWWYNTRQDACYWQITSVVAASSDGPGDVPDGPGGYSTIYGLCWNQCTGFTTQGYCLWPDDSICPQYSSDLSQEFNVRLSNGSCNTSNPPNDVCETFGTVEYCGTYTITCTCTAFLGIGCPNGKTVSDGGNKTKADVQLTNWTDPNLPFSPFDEKYTHGPAAVSNITIQSGEVGNECIHRHRLAFDSDTPHTFEMKTRAATARADSGLVSQITIDRNTDAKADKYIQPYIVTEYLIKI